MFAPNPQTASPSVRVDRAIVELKTDRGMVKVVRAVPGLLRSTVAGHIDKTILRVLIDTHEFEAHRRTESVHYFHDWTGATGYDSAVRVEATKYTLSLPEPYSHVHIVTKSKLVNMGVATGSLALQLAGRPFFAYTSKATFEIEYQRMRVALSTI